jgi:CubicO group peptidase (beta-lactamase class C family)
MLDHHATLRRWLDDHRGILVRISRAYAVDAMTVLDLARWGQVHLRGERGDSGVVSAQTFRMLHQPVGGGPYGLGWVVREADGRRVIWHNGSSTMWYAIVAFDAAADRGVVLITNGGIGAGPALDAAAMAVLARGVVAPPTLSDVVAAIMRRIGR